MSLTVFTGFTFNMSIQVITRATTITLKISHVLGTILVALYMPPNLILTIILHTWIADSKVYSWLSGQAGCPCKFVFKPCISPSVVYCLNIKKLKKKPTSRMNFSQIKRRGFVLAEG